MYGLFREGEISDHTKGHVWCINLQASISTPFSINNIVFIVYNICWNICIGILECHSFAFTSVFERERERERERETEEEE